MSVFEMTSGVELLPHPDDERIGVVQMHDVATQNTFTHAFVDALMAAIRAAGQDTTYHVLILRGLPKVFCAGASKDMLIAVKTGNLNVRDVSLPDLLLDVPVPVVAEMTGSAVGGGFVLGLFCDVVVMNEARMYGVNFMSLGFTPGMGCTRLLSFLVGEYVANEMMYRGRPMKGKTFRGRSLINYVLPSAEIEPKCLDIAMDVAERPRESLVILKQSLVQRRRQELSLARVQEDFMHRISFNNPAVGSIIEEMYGPIEGL